MLKNRTARKKTEKKIKDRKKGLKEVKNPKDC